MPQRGVLGVWQAVDAGMPQKRLYRDLRDHGWTQAESGIWLAPASAATHERDCWVALVAVRLRAVLTAESALYLVGAIRKPPPRALGGR